MSRNLFGISAKGVLLRAASGLYAIVFCQAIIQDTLWLWILSIIGGLIIIALLRAPDHELARGVKPPPSGTSIDRLRNLALPPPGPLKGYDTLNKIPAGRLPQGDDPQAATSRPEATSSPERQYLSKERRQAVQLVLQDSPPICLN